MRFTGKEHERTFWGVVMFIDIVVTLVCTFVETLNGTFMICACFYMYISASKEG